MLSIENCFSCKSLKRRSSTYMLPFLQDNPEEPFETPTSSLAVEYLDHRRKCAEAHNAKALQVIHNFFTT